MASVDVIFLTENPQNKEQHIKKQPYTALTGKILAAATHAPKGCALRFMAGKESVKFTNIWTQQSILLNDLIDND